MVTSQQCYKKYGDPTTEKHMVVWDVPAELELGAIPRRVYCNKDLVEPLKKAFTNIVKRGLAHQVRTWDGCFNIRKKRGARSSSLHSWGIAIDINAAWNPFGKEGTLSQELADCFIDAGFDWGGNWERADFMHFQLKKI